MKWNGRRISIGNLWYGKNKNLRQESRRQRFLNWTHRLQCVLVWCSLSVYRYASLQGFSKIPSHWRTGICLILVILVRITIELLFKKFSPKHKGFIYNSYVLVNNYLLCPKVRDFATKTCDYTIFNTYPVIYCKFICDSNMMTPISTEYEYICLMVKQ